ncbi:MAG: hypothetical protein HYV27_19630 [Candidatus Hydrogenedentes bacterium]|nr:hypothetical protein [Candidatus Hydrogenedentota bacterium]
MAFPVLLEQEGALLEDDPELIEIDGNGNVVAFRSHPLFLGADTLFATRNGDFVISGPQFTLARMDADFNVLWQDLTLLPQDGQFEFPTEHTVFAETENGDLLVARTVYQVVGENYHDVIVARISSSGEVLFIRNIDGEGNDGFLPE